MLQAVAPKCIWMLTSSARWSRQWLSCRLHFSRSASSCAEEASAANTGTCSATLVSTGRGATCNNTLLQFICPCKLSLGLHYRAHWLVPVSYTVVSSWGGATCNNTLLLRWFVHVRRISGCTTEHTGWLVFVS